jgi:hypothetical protein
MNRRFLLGLVATIIFTVGTVQFIRISNDHVECSIKEERTEDAAGRTTVTTEHICREKFSF